MRRFCTDDRGVTVQVRRTLGIACGTLLLLAICPAIATAQGRVFGSGRIQYLSGARDAGNWFRHIAVNAGIDENGVYGLLTWEGDVIQTLPHGNNNNWNNLAGPANPWLLEVTDVTFFGNAALVSGVVISAPYKADIGQEQVFLFIDNSGTGDPDEIGLFGEITAIDAGNFTVR